MGAESNAGDQEGHLGVFAASAVPAWIHHRTTLAFLQVNPAALKEFGYSLEEFREMTIADLRPPEEQERLAAMLEAEGAGPRNRGAWELLRKDGTKGLFDLVANDFTIDGQDGVFVVVYPVTSQVAHMAAQAVKDARLVGQLRTASADVTRKLAYAQAVMGGMVDGVIALDAENRVTLLNSAGAAMLGWTEEEALGKHVREVVSALSDLAPTLVHEDIFIHRDGTTLPVALTIARLDDDAAKGGIVVTFRNLSKEREERFRHHATERMYRQIVEGASDLIYVMARDGTILEANPAAERLLGYTADEIRGMNARDILTPESHGESLSKLTTKLQGVAEITRYNVQMRTKEGGAIWMEVSSRLVERADREIVIHGIARDITARVLEAEALQREQDNLRALMETVDSAVWVFDGRGRIQYVNEGMCRTLGFDRETIMRAGFFGSRLREADAVAMRARFDEWEHSATERASYEVGILNARDEWRTLSVTIGRIIFDDRPLYIASAFDVTDVRRAEAEFRELNHRLVDAQERERAQLARELHDEFGQDLTALTLMLGGDSLDEESHAEVMNIIKKLIAATRSMALDLRPSALDHLGLRTASSSLIERFGRRSGLLIEFHCDLPAGARYEREIELAAYRILQEALTNVARHSGSRSAVCTIALDAECIVLSVRDFGCGFDIADTSVLQGKAGVMGIRERAAAVAGDMRIVSQPGAGTVVDVRLPARVQKGAQS